MRFATFFPAAALVLGAGTAAAAQGSPDLLDIRSLEARGVGVSKEDVAKYVPPACMQLITAQGQSCSSTQQDAGPNNPATTACIKNAFNVCGVVPAQLLANTQAHLQRPNDQAANQAFMTQRMRFIAALMAVFSQEKLSDITEGTPLAQAVLAYIYGDPQLAKFVGLAQENPSILAGVLTSGGDDDANPGAGGGGGGGAGTGTGPGAGGTGTTTGPGAGSSGDPSPNAGTNAGSGTGTTTGPDAGSTGSPSPGGGASSRRRDLVVSRQEGSILQSRKFDFSLKTAIILGVFTIFFGALVLILLALFKIGKDSKAKMG